MKSAGTRIRNPKKRGEWAELRFMAKVAELGFKLSKPWGDSAPYDVAVELEGYFVRVQVKSTMYRVRPKKRHYQRGNFMCEMRSYPMGHYYDGSEFEILAVYVIPKDTWYIIPAQVATKKTAIRVCPGNDSNRYEQYREAWHLLRDYGRTAPTTVNLQAVVDPFLQGDAVAEAGL